MIKTRNVCNAAPMISRRENYKDTSIGLPNVTCWISRSGAVYLRGTGVAIPRVLELHRVIAQSVIEKTGRFDRSGDCFSVNISVVARISRVISGASGNGFALGERTGSDGAIAERLLRLGRSSLGAGRVVPD